MSDLRPLLDESPSGEAADLLRAAVADAPRHPEASHARVAAAMAASPNVEVVASAAKPIGGASLSLALAGLALVAGSAVFVASRTDAPPPANAPVASALAVVEPAQPAAPVLDVHDSAASPLPSLRVEDLPSAAPVTAPSSAPSAPRAAAVDELAMIDAARAELSDGHPEAALRRVAAYRALGRGRTYSVEADVIEIEALSASGRTAEARASAERFLKVHPRSPYEQRIQRLLEEVP